MRSSFAGGTGGTGTGETVGFTAGGGTNVTDASTAYRISDVVKALKNYGLLAA